MFAFLPAQNAYTSKRSLRVKTRNTRTLFLKCGVSSKSSTLDAKPKASILEQKNSAVWARKSHTAKGTILLNLKLKVKL